MDDIVTIDMINLFSPQNDEEKQWRKFFMKSTGIVRKVDELGRIVLPIELRRTYDLAVKDAIEIYTDDDKIILKKFQRTCIFCGSGEECVEYKGKTICAACMAELKGEAK